VRGFSFWSIYGYTKALLSGGVMAAFIFGLIYGSFLNVVILRWDDWVSILNGRSSCPSCKTNLKWYDLIPIVSFASLAGRCRYCQKPISWQYPFVELASAVLVTAGFMKFFPASGDLTMAIMAFVAYLVVIGALLAVFFHDLYEMLVPDLLAYILLATALIVGVYFYGWQSALYGLLVGLLPISLLVYPSKGTWMGEGDVKIAAALGALVGYPNAIAFMALAFIIGGLYGAVALLASKVKMRTAVPFAPFMIIGAMIVFFYGQEIISWYMGVFGYGL
jgi:prepilin signal peptidase PulO-like enzyme (type II secretory pathway)